MFKLQLCSIAHCVPNFIVIEATCAWAVQSYSVCGIIRTASKLKIVHFTFKKIEITGCSDLKKKLKN